MAWVVTKSLARLKSDFNTTFPNKSHASDGTIGDAAHQAEVSGHNPDDTPGSKSEYTDADNIPEVRAIDVDNILRADPVNMQTVIDRMLKSPNDLNRLMYIIYNRQIWRKRNGWRKEVYTGASAHTEHAHFSGDPAFDEDSAPWISVTSFAQGGSIMASTDDIIHAWIGGFPKTTDGTRVLPVEWEVNREKWEAKMDATMAAIMKLLGVAQTDIDDIQARTGAVNVTDAQAQVIGNAIADKLSASQDNAITEADKPVIVALVKQALREGTA